MVLSIMGKVRLHTIFFLIIVAVTFSPLVMPERIMTPWFLGMPRTLWAGILISLSLLVLTLIAAIRLAREEEQKTKD
jgi:hypothetical protein